MRSAATGQRLWTRVFMVGSGENDRRSGLRQHGPMPPRRALALSLLLLVGFLLAPPPGAAATTTNVAQRYEITATLDVGANRLDAVETLTVTNRSSRPIDYLNLSVVPRALGYLSMPDPITVDGDVVEATWTTGINLRVPLPDLAPRATATLRIPFTLEIGRSPDAFTARTSVENGAPSFGQWFPIVSTEHDVYGLGDPQSRSRPTSSASSSPRRRRWAATRWPAPGCARRRARAARRGSASRTTFATSASS